jgi:hypothetical protein
VYDAITRGPGKKYFLIDEVWQWQNNQQIPYELAKCAQAGREEGVELGLATQLPHKLTARSSANPPSWFASGRMNAWH